MSLSDIDLDDHRGVNVRQLAALSLAPVLRGRAALNVSEVMDACPPEQRALLQTLCLGVLRHYFSLQYSARQLLSKKLKPKDADIHALILIGLYQLEHLRVPDHAAIHTVVEASKKLRKHWASKLINGVLRNYLRQRAALEKDACNDQEVQWQHPHWLIEIISRAYPNHWQNVLAANNLEPPLTLRVNLKQTERDHYLACLHEAGIDAHALESSVSAIRLQTKTMVAELPGFDEGNCSVQDEAAQLAPTLLPVRAGQRVLDACSAPGGKAGHLLERHPDIDLTCVELDQTRIERIQANFARLNLSARVHQADVTELSTWWDGRHFDHILLDAPCSGSGVIRRHPDIKLLRRPEDIVKLAELQLAMLKQLWTTLQPGGTLLYATCSVLPEENVHVVAAFLNSCHDAQHSPIVAEWGQEADLGRQLLPEQGGHDGFYYCRLEKIIT